MSSFILENGVEMARLVGGVENPVESLILVSDVPVFIGIK
jgi:hypothetical protein